MTDPAVQRVVSEIIRSPEDKRVYRGLEFTNGLKAILISDPTTDKSSAALDVQIGNIIISIVFFSCGKGREETHLVVLKCMAEKDAQLPHSPPTI